MASASSSWRHFGLHGCGVTPTLLPLCPSPTNTEGFSAPGHLSPHYKPEAGKEAGGRADETQDQVSPGKRRDKAHETLIRVTHSCRAAPMCVPLSHHQDAPKGHKGLSCPTVSVSAHVSPQPLAAPISKGPSCFCR